MKRDAVEFLNHLDIARKVLKENGRNDLAKNLDYTEWSPQKMESIAEELFEEARWREENGGVGNRLEEDRKKVKEGKFSKRVEKNE